MPEPTVQQADRLTTRMYRWLDQRFEIQRLVDYMSHKTVPMHGHSIFYYLGGLTLFLFVVQVATGILLLMYYRPGTDTAYESVRFIVSEVTFGWLIRSLHSWAANLMILMAFIHMFTVYFTYAYRKPRELTWLTGIGLMGLAMMFGFSGYLLPWNELAFFATKVGTGMAGSIPLIGDWLMVIMRNGEEVTGATIGRFFGLHVAILPALFTVVLSLHLIFIQRQGMSEPLEWQGKSQDKKKFMNFFPQFMYRDMLLWLVALNVLALLAVIFPDGVGVIHWPLGDKADPFAPPPPTIRPEWYFMFAFQFLKMMPPHILFMEGELFGILFFIAGGIIWTLVPFWDRRSLKGRRLPLVIWLGIIVIVFMIFMSVLGYVAE